MRRRLRRGFPEGRDRPGLKDPGTAAGVVGPLRVLRRSVVLLDAAAQLGQLVHLVVAQRRGRRLILLRLTHDRAAGLGHALDHQLLAATAAVI